MGAIAAGVVALSVVGWLFLGVSGDREEVTVALEEQRQDSIRFADVIARTNELTARRDSIGQRVAILGAGGIGFDVAELVAHSGPSAALDVDVFAREWGIDFRNHPRGTGTAETRAAWHRRI